MENQGIVRENEKPWGGPWTDQKLDAFEKYVTSYLTIMNKQQQWQTIYFDGFAGSGTRKIKKSSDLLLIPISEEDQKMYRGAAERVVRMNEPFTFDYYYFIEKSQSRLNKLKKKLNPIQESEDKELVFRTGDCNAELQNLGYALQSKKYAALVFLDPFGMQIDWKSIEALSGTRSDIWLLLPTTVIVNRLIDRKGELKNHNKLESFFGLNEDEIREEFYMPTGQTNMFDHDEEHVKKIVDPINKIAALYIKRLKNIWKYVTEPALRLDNRRGAPLFHLVFASNNNALKIANYIITNK